MKTILTVVVLLMTTPFSFGQATQQDAYAAMQAVSDAAGPTGVSYNTARSTLVSQRQQLADVLNNWNQAIALGFKPPAGPTPATVGLELDGVSARLDTVQTTFVTVQTNYNAGIAAMQNQDWNTAVDDFALAQQQANDGGATATVESTYMMFATNPEIIQLQASLNAWVQQRNQRP